MLNITVALLVQHAALANSPLLSLTHSPLTRRINFDRLTIQHFINPIFYTQSQTFNLLLSQSTFSNAVSQVARQDEIKMKEFSEHQNYHEVFSLVITGCRFSSISYDKGAGAAFCAISQLHTLHIANTQFADCYCGGSEYIEGLTHQVSGGVLVFTGSKSEISSCCVVKNNAIGNSKTFQVVSSEEGLNSIKYSLFVNNGDKTNLKGHSLFSLDHGRCEVISSNITNNDVPGGYAGGAIGFASYGRAGYTLLKNNTGKSVFGICALGTYRASIKVNFCFVNQNTATKYGVIMRLTSTLKLDNVIFTQNVGQYFYGTAPIKVARSNFDCDKPAGLVEDEATMWNAAVKRTLKIKVPESCDLNYPINRANVTKRHRTEPGK
ncbi:hypothetical protein TRFO_24891 [Tritrichomonas foetus]|uniref:Polymorphic outer membrane protein n=1 Tax=Tritrichomonas foetus TaxID=1144522 RepID=A0A1J4KB61_9EUKA|nr:hypothetical protein TRFO_24891 [Tritrichomonas foetus]|eukprot:OHT06934.1 hypothetical protein TRFO_24891 [Tritrichomonas foetus]